MSMKFLQDHKGDNSSTRLLGALIIIDIMAAWTFLTITKSEMVDLPSTVLGIIGMAATWLVANKAIEVNGAKKEGA